MINKRERGCCERDPCKDDGFDAVIGIPERDHSRLENRDLPAQHPIHAITDLQSELKARVLKEDMDAISNQEIYDILGG